MPRRPELDPRIDMHLMIPTSWHAKVTMELFSPLEGRVPIGKYQEFFLARLKDYYDTVALDLAPYIPGATSGVLVVRGSPEAIAVLKGELGG